MARFYPSNSVSSTGVSSDDVTITSLDVPESKTALTSDSNDEVIKGKLKEVNSAVESVGSIDDQNSRVSLSVPTRGLYSLTAKLFTSFSDLANLIGLVSGKIAQGESILGISGTYNGLGDATQADVRSNKTFSTSELSEAPGTMAEHAGGKFKPGTSDKVVVSKDRYLTGDVIVQGDPNLIAANIKKNVTIFGIKGTADGWVVEETDIYNEGVDPYSIRISPISEGVARLEYDHIATIVQTAKYCRFYTRKKVNLKKYTKVNFEFTTTAHATSATYINIAILSMSGEPYGETANDKIHVEELVVAAFNPNSPIGKRITASVSLNANSNPLRSEGHLEFRIYTANAVSHTSATQFHRIWLSMD